MPAAKSPLQDSIGPAAAGVPFASGAQAPAAANASVGVNIIPTSDIAATVTSGSQIARALERLMLDALLRRLPRRTCSIERRSILHPQMAQTRVSGGAVDCSAIDTMRTGRQPGVVATSKSRHNPVRILWNSAILREMQVFHATRPNRSGLVWGGDEHSFSGGRRDWGAGALVASAAWRLRAWCASRRRESDIARKARTRAARLSDPQPERQPAAPEIGDAAVGRRHRRDRDRQFAQLFMGPAQGAWRYRASRHCLRRRRHCAR